MKILVVDVGGTHVKVLATGISESRKALSGSTMSAQQMVELVKRLAADWEYSAISIGFPGAVQHHQPAAEPRNLGPGWLGYDFERAFGCPVRMINDAAMQALGSYEGGRMLFLGLGTGMGSALIVDGVVAPLELAHLPYRKKRSFEDYVGVAGLQRRGKKRWRASVHDVSARLKAATQAEDLVLGGGNAKYLKSLPAGARRGSNAHAFVGGFRMWAAPEKWHSPRDGGSRKAMN